MSDATPPPSRRQSRADRAKEVAQLVRSIQEQAEEKEFIRLAPGPPPRSPVWYAVLVLLVVLNGWVWIERPAWLVGERPSVQSPEERERALRFHMYVQGQKIEAFRRAEGRLPASIEEAGTPVPGTRYQPSGLRSWEILGEEGTLRLLLRSSQPADDFLGAYEPLLGTGAP